ncbi:MAG: hypothetical protein HC880_09215 [Bacteroidia bacterium]|nr:hypothetical protein [Bacteroidia bacterium]
MNYKPIGEDFQRALAWEAHGDYHKATEMYAQILAQDANCAEAWHQAGLVWWKAQNHPAARHHWEQARWAYDQRIEQEENQAYNLLGKACIYGLLGRKEEMLEALLAALQFYPAYAETVSEEEDLRGFWKDPDFQQLVAEQQEVLENLRFRGQALSLEDLDPEDMEQINRLVKLLKKNRWETEPTESDFASGAPISPQASGYYQAGSGLGLRLDYHLDEDLIFLEFSDPEDQETQRYRLYYKKSPERVLQVLIDFSQSSDQSNRMDLIRQLIPLCRALYLESANGVRIKLSKI